MGPLSVARAMLPETSTALSAASRLKTSSPQPERRCLKDPDEGHLSNAPAPAFCFPSRRSGLVNRHFGRDPRTSGIGAQQSFSRRGVRVSNAPRTAVRGTAIEAARFDPRRQNNSISHALRGAVTRLWSTTLLPSTPPCEQVNSREYRPFEKIRADLAAAQQEM